MKNYLKKASVKLGQEKKYDFIFSIFHPFHMAPHAAIQAGKELQIPTIVKIDDAVYQKTTGLKSIQRKIEKAYNSKALKQSSLVLVPNPETKTVVENFYGVNSDKISFLPNGVDLSKFTKSNLNSKRIIFSGAMYHHRGLDILLNTLPSVLQKISDLEELTLINVDSRRISEKGRKFKIYKSRIKHAEINIKKPDATLTLTPNVG